ncbi:sulfatase-like hydrolase/transferase [Paenibacillus radicis (ex Xue et al. 2023)]|uniref:Sulfatase-like hydrolase/transferase n=1 Tax=Paenibacillus radicis (ex Xue et al. 2023) TaxID=2972489 RepID=A0ABT1Y9V9_9BACL|nr:sulfatase-like hydrolase/transferase [Paenibacillus radicis (ex Xue et al. 2023)]MCR8629978.1 sulfatase-like hydrolase/transferase [Paenibacillus radicis (ex Xue et al. 2023)]
MENQQQKRPNVIVFFTDQQRWDTSSLHGNPMQLMPNFERMALGGTHITHSFTCQPVCGPARSCLQTGKYATTTGCFVNGIPLPEESKTLAHYFNEEGYRTGYIGKWHLAGVEPVPEGKRGGYQYWLASDVLEFTSDSYRTVMYNNDNEPVKLPGYRVDAITDAAIRYIDGQKENPFYLFLSYLEPHHQNHLDDYPAPDGYRERYTGAWLPPDLAALGGTVHQHIAGYYGMVKRLDEALGRLMDALKSLELDENTIILFTSDHGCHFKTRNEEYKRSGHDASIRVPSAITGPGFWGGRQLQELVSLIDLPPTLLDAAGIPVPADMQGRSLLTVDKSPWPEDVFVQISESQVGRAVRTKRWKYGVTAPEKNSFTDAGSDRYQEAYLYDLKSDPYELTNLIGLDSHREAADRMKQRLIRRMQETGENAPVIELAPSRPGGQRRVTTKEAMS